MKIISESTKLTNATFVISEYSEDSCLFTIIPHIDSVDKTIWMHHNELLEVREMITRFIKARNLVIINDIEGKDERSS